MGPNGATLASLISYVIVFVLRAINTRGLIHMSFAPLRLTINCVLIGVETVLMLRQTPGWPVWCTLLTAVICLFNLQGILGMLRQLLRRRSPRKQA